MTRSHLASVVGSSTYCSGGMNTSFRLLLRLLSRERKRKPLGEGEERAGGSVKTDRTQNPSTLHSMWGAFRKRRLLPTRRGLAAREKGEEG